MNDEMIAAAASSPEPLAALGRAYVRFALANQGEFAVMFRPELLDPDAPEFVVQSTAAFQRLTDAISATPEAACEGDDVDVTAARAWSLVHGLATLIINGSLPANDQLIDQVLTGE